jgi:glycogen operon protein
MEFRFRDDVTAFMCGHGACVPARQPASPRSTLPSHNRPPLQSINFITTTTASPGRLVSYNEKAQSGQRRITATANNHNLSWNSGSKGQSKNRTVHGLRSVAGQNGGSSLLLSQGCLMCGRYESARSPRATQQRLEPGQSIADRLVPAEKFDDNGARERRRAVGHPVSPAITSRAAVFFPRQLWADYDALWKPVESLHPGEHDRSHESGPWPFSSTAAYWPPRRYFFVISTVSLLLRPPLRARSPPAGTWRRMSIPVARAAVNR